MAYYKLTVPIQSENAPIINVIENKFNQLLEDVYYSKKENNILILFFSSNEDELDLENHFKSIDNGIKVATITGEEYGEADFCEWKLPIAVGKRVDKLMKEMMTGYDKLGRLTGILNVKNEVRSLINLIELQKKRADLNLSNTRISYHLVFTGSPGTGKTTVARIIAEIYSKLGILKKGHLIETDRSGLVAEYLGQTAVKVNRMVDSAIDGILFIDEAYSIVGKNNDDFGKEAVAALIKRIEDDRERLVVILAGYKEEMEEFINTNPGFQSRFNNYIHFEDYLPEELLEIFEKLCKNDSYTLHPEAKSKLFELIKNAYKNRDRNFGNGRFVRNLFERTISNLANRAAQIENISIEELSKIKAEDIS